MERSGSCQSWLRRHKAGDGKDDALALKVL
jgi:hypothetical protein